MNCYFEYSFFIIFQVRAGLVPNLLCLMVVTISTLTFGVWVFDVHEVKWDPNENITSSMNF